MNPAEMANIRSKCIEWCRMPSLSLQLTIDIQRCGQDPDDLVSFMSGLLLGSDPLARSWISLFIRNGQKRRSESLVLYRRCLVDRLKEFTSALDQTGGGNGGALEQKHVVKASVLLRLFTALRGIAGMKFSDEETQLLFQLVTCQPPPSPAGVKFVSLGLCMLIACNSIISVSSLEKRAIDWIRWLVREEDYFGRKSGVFASFGEMLLLMAIHFHSHQLNAICELVCQTLGMKIVIRTNSMSRMKAIFTQEIFTEQVTTPATKLFRYSARQPTRSGGGVARGQGAGDQQSVVGNGRLSSRALHSPAAEEQSLLQAQGAHQGLDLQVARPTVGTRDS
jgi:integrator complex subunit 2